MNRKCVGGERVNQAIDFEELEKVRVQRVEERKLNVDFADLLAFGKRINLAHTHHVVIITRLLAAGLKGASYKLQEKRREVSRLDVVKSKRRRAFDHKAAPLVKSLLLFL